MAHVHPLERLIKAGVHSSFIDQALNKLLEDQIALEEAELSRLRPLLLAYESNFKMSSQTFYSRYQSGEMGDEIDFFEWNVTYKMYLDSQKRLSLLREEA